MCLGSYELLLHIARGGMADVWMGRFAGNHGFSKIVALKTILPAFVGNPKFEQRFLREAYLGAHVLHPNVCSVYALGEEPLTNTLFMAMQWVDGGSLHELAAHGPLKARTAVRIAADVCGALHALHELKDATGRHLHAVHLDISPDNLLMSAEGIVKVTDFGIARLLAPGEHAQAATEDVVGKPHYMSPEQTVGGALDRRSDVFAIGSVLYELTTGAKPFDGASAVETMQAVNDAAFVPPGHLVADYPGEIERIILRALARNPEERFATAEEMQLALETWLLREPLVTPSDMRNLVRERIGDRRAAYRAYLRAA